MNKLNIKKKGSRESIINDVIDDVKLRNFTSGDITDDQTQELFYEIYSYFADKLRFNSNEREAWNRMLNSLSRGKSWAPEYHRNNIFKAAHSLGIKLPSSAF
jgi:hypothetical protein